MDLNVIFQNNSIYISIARSMAVQCPSFPFLCKLLPSFSSLRTLIFSNSHPPSLAPLFPPHFLNASPYPPSTHQAVRMEPNHPHSSSIPSLCSLHSFSLIFILIHTFISCSFVLPSILGVYFISFLQFLSQIKASFMLS